MSSAARLAALALTLNGGLAGVASAASPPPAAPSSWLRRTFMTVSHVTARPKSGPAAEADLAAAALRAEMRSLSAELAEQREDYVRRLQELAGPLVRHEGTPEARAAYAQGERLTAEHRRASGPLILKLTVNALRLKAYRETGALPDSVPNLAELKAAVAGPWTPHSPEVPLPAGDLRALRLQLERWELKPAPKPRETLAPPPRTPAPAPKPAVRPLLRFEQDAGTGRERVDPIPGLLIALASPTPRARALAADELGRQGASAAKAVGPLRAALADPDARVRASAALALGGVGVCEPGLLDALRALRLDKNADVRLSASLALARLGAGSAAP